MRPKKVKIPVKLLPAPSLARSGVRIAALSLWLRFRHFATPMHLLFVAAGAYLVLTSAFTASFFWPRTVNFSVAKDNCFTSPTLLPNLIAKDQSHTYAATPTKGIALAGYPLYSHTTCITPVQAPEATVTEDISFSPLGLSFLKKNIRVVADRLPTVANTEALAGPIATKDPLVFTLSQADRVFDYQLTANSQTADCTKNQTRLTCDTAALRLEQSASYTLTLQRVFKGEVHQAVLEQTAATVGAVQLASSSIAAGQTVFDVPAQLTLTFTKEIRTFDGIKLSLVAGDTRQDLPVEFSAEGASLTVRFAEPLARSSSFELTIESITAPDGGHLPAPLVIPFATSGGPKVQGANIGSYKVSTTGNIVLYFDAAVSTGQDLSQFIKIEMNGAVLAASITRSGHSVTINPADTLPKCTGFTVKVLNGLQNEHGIAGGSAWTYNSRTICQSVFSIGASVQGRGITAYRFGSGSSYVVFVGGTHGNEKSSVSSLNSFIDHLERNPGSVPAHRSVVVIPNLNPDGYAASRRTNANNVDLNRNFPANNWKQGVTMPGGSYNPNGGGSAPLSEPESSALADYVLSVSPRLVLTYHAAAGVVMPNDAGDSNDLAHVYDQKSNLGYEPSSQTGQIFQYDTTGSFEEWLYDKHGIPALLVELWTTGSNEFTKNQAAMLHMAALP